MSVTDIQDERLQTLFRFIVDRCQIKVDKILKFLEDESNVKALCGFFDQADNLRLYIQVYPTGIVECFYNKYPPAPKSKIFYFIKKDKSTYEKSFTMATLMQNFYVGDLNKAPFFHISAFVNQIMGPILSNPKNHVHWPETLCDNVLVEFRQLHTRTAIVDAKLNGRVLLAHPKGIDKVLCADSDPLTSRGDDVQGSALYAIETAVIEWLHRVNHELKKSSDQLIREGQHPLPKYEFNFWKTRLNCISDIYRQLVHPDVKKMALLLEKNNSVYSDPFKDMFKQVVRAFVETETIVVFLTPLQRHIEDIESTEFCDVKPLLQPMVHVLSLVWVNCHYYRSMDRLVVILIEICNTLINQCTGYLDPVECVKEESSEGLRKVKMCIEILEHFRSVCDAYKENVKNSCASQGIEPSEWNFHPSWVFSRFDMFMKRLDMLQTFFKYSLEYGRLEKMEMLGIMGSRLSAECVEIYERFSQYQKNFIEAGHDTLNPRNVEYEKEFEKYMGYFTVFDYHLASIALRAFDSAGSLIGQYKTLIMFGPLLDRPRIHTVFQDCYGKLLSNAHRCMDHCKLVFDRQISREKRLVPKNMPPVSGFVEWAVSLRKRADSIVMPMDNVSKERMDQVELAKLYEKHKELLALLDGCIVENLAQFSACASQKCLNSLKKTLLRSQPPRGVLSVNFEFDLTESLKEAHYLQRLAQQLPDDVLYARGLEDTLVLLRVKMLRLVKLYNAVRGNAQYVEANLLSQQLDEFDTQIKPCLETMLWENADLEFVDTRLSEITQLENRLSKSQENIRQIEKELQPFTSTPLFSRREKKNDNMLNLDERVQAVVNRYKAIDAAGKKAHELVKENLELFSVVEDSQEWKCYLEYVDDLVCDALADCVIFNLQYLVKNIDNLSKPDPLFETKLTLEDRHTMFNPGMLLDDRNNLMEIIDDLINDIVHQANHIHRFVAPVPDNPPALAYHELIQGFNDVNHLTSNLSALVVKAMKSATDIRVSLKEKYDFFWKMDPKYCLERFVRFSKTDYREPEDPSMGDSDNPPNLDMFRSEIKKFDAYYEEVEALKDQELVNGWLRLDMRPFKHILLKTIQIWKNEFKQFLVKKVTNKLMNLKMFIDSTTLELKVDCKELDYNGLVRVLKAMRGIRDNITDIDIMFDPLKDIVNLLRELEEEIDPNTLKLLEKLPDEWMELKNLEVVTKQNTQERQEKEVKRIKERSSELQKDTLKFSEDFMKSELFDFKCTNVYAKFDQWAGKLKDASREIEELLVSAQTFEVRDMPNYSHLKLTERNMSLLKRVWDYILMVREYMESWKMCKWKDINFGDIEDGLREIMMDMRVMDKDVKRWPIFQALENAMKEINISVQTVRDLQDPAIKERHWIELMNATNARINIDENTTLDQLLSLNLHKFEEETRTIVSKANNEQNIERELEKISHIWVGLQFEYTPHERTKLVLPRATEELTTTLEESQVKVLDMLNNRDNGFFLDKIQHWHKLLGLADKVTSVWFEVQRVWSGLESIFVLCDDIKTRLPDETAHFFKIDELFRNLAVDFQEHPVVVEVCSLRESLFSEISEILKGLQVCEKALADYLETKRLAFPRFYFVSAADLMDIVSNGKRVESVIRHLSKLFDSINKLDFIDPKSEVKQAKAMWAKDGEKVTLAKVITLTGQVEEWLNVLLKEMISTMRTLLEEAVSTYEDKPREQWILDNASQISLTGSQIYWTTEVNIAFSRLEEGLENALKDYNKKQIQQLSSLINMLLTDLSRESRQKIMTICTIDVHNRDVVARLIDQKAENSQAFTWLSQLRHRWDEKEKDCFANICNACFRFAYEYLGNQPRLVITPLTDRCYITLTQSLHLCMSGAPAGPAGTGKTETTKDLGRAMGVMVYVFNCSEQMDYKSVGNIYKGLAQAGSWGCFDEFNRISVEVLSVVAVQVKTIQDAIRQKKQRFNFLGEIISLDPAVGLFITMNPGYAGRTELPENLKALFRPCAMVVPDFELICEIMLVAEGFLDARLLARKFITLYQLCKELLSKQDHYDWGLRAIKSVLVVAGSLKRADSTLPEDQVLMRALRDFNTPKIVTDDTPVFMGLIGDLFPALNVPRQRKPQFEANVKAATEDLGLQPEDNFILKVVQLQELFDVRHSVFIVGNAGTGKSKVWNTLHHTFKMLGEKPMAVDLNPKAVTNDELFGIINPATREWKDGLFSVIMRDLANVTSTNGPKWIVLDGDIDPMWIESLNTVMDDNKILTLASNERIPLTPSMRLLFEISHLKTATPATVSRAGILYINPGDLGWQPFVSSWLDNRVKKDIVLSRIERNSLSICFDKYVQPCLEMTRSKYKKITFIPDISHVQSICHFLDTLLKKTAKKAVSKGQPSSEGVEWTKEMYEVVFVFACIWAFGGCLFKDQLADHRVEFSKWWQAEFKNVKIGSQGTVFDYYLNMQTMKFQPWTDLVGEFELEQDAPLQATLVPTTEVARVGFFLDLLIQAGRPVMLVGNAGTGKSVLLEYKFSQLPDEFMVKKIAFNYYTTSEMLQQVLEKPIEKKAGKNYGPPGQKKLIYFIDDMNMPEVDKYFTVQPHTLIRQHMDYSHWYDRQKLTLKVIHNTQYVAAMNPTAGSFSISPRLQRHFTVFALSFPNEDIVRHIYKSILRQHMQQNKINPNVSRFAETVVELSVNVHNKVAATFLPTAIKFHYIFNLRDLSNIFQGLLFIGPECCPSLPSLLRVWRHEAERVYSDKLMSQEDVHTYLKISKSLLLSHFTDQSEADIFMEPLLYCHFAQGLQSKMYMPVSSMDNLSNILNDALATYNESKAVMNLVLFKDAIQHVMRINRILEMPRGNALLIGIGGSGKQSLSRLAASLAGMDVSQITLRKGYGLTELKNDLSHLYLKAGLKCMPVAFLMTDQQVADESFLICINDFLASGEIPNLFPDEVVEQVMQSMRPEVKMLGLVDSNDNCWKCFIDKVRRYMRVVLCFSPVGATIRLRARRFPALVNCTCIDWFHEWPHEALLSVSRRFLEEVPLLTPELKDSVSEFMAYCHSAVNEVSQVYYAQERRSNYTTPKSFLEQIELYKRLLKTKHQELLDKVDRLVNGLERLKDAAGQTEELKVQLAAQEVVVNEKAKNANQLITVVSAETEKVTAEKEITAAEEAKVAVIKKEVEKKQRECETDLRRAEPALVAAQEALNTLNKANLSELKALTTPPPDVAMVGAAVMVLLAMDGKLPRDRSWKAAKATVFSKVDSLLNRLLYYEKEQIHPNSKAAAVEYVKQPNFDADIIRNKSVAAAGLCAWVINICKFHDVFLEVKPKRDALEAANAELNDATQHLENLQNKVRKLEASLGKLTDEFNAAMAEKMRCQQEADFTAKTLDLANRLVSGFASENIRWANEVEELKNLVSTLPGDVLLTSSFISYLGYFTKPFRVELIEKMWRPFMENQSVPIPIRPGLDPLSMLIDDAIVAQWNNENLPGDRMSIENATILTFCERWPLMVDPQLQAVKWIKIKYGTSLNVVRTSQRGYLDVIEKAISAGETVLIENIGESLDAILDPVIGRVTIKKGKFVKLGDKEVPYDSKFRLLLHTKLGNPHYKPEMQAQTTIINFTVTRDGLEEQLLATVVSKERPDLETVKSSLTKQQNEFKITLKNLEDSLLAKLASSGGNFLGDHSMVENLETNKRTAKEIEEKVAEAKVTEAEINSARDHYRTVATRASLLYFIMNDLSRIHPMYQFSLKAFGSVFEYAIENTPEAEDSKVRLENLLDSITFSIFTYTTRGLFERDKLIFTTLMVTQIMLINKTIDSSLMDYLLRYPAIPDLKSPVDFLSDLSWGGVKALVKLPTFKDLDKDIQGSAKRWKTFVESESPEKEKFPQEWKNKSHMEQLCMMRALRPDRMIYALNHFVSETMGSKYVENRAVEFSRSYSESSPSVPIFFILSPGVDPLKDVEIMGNKLGFTIDQGNFHNISLGQGQEIVAEKAMEMAAKEGQWVVLQNVHLVARWLPTLEKLLEAYAESAHESYRVFISAEPAASADSHIMPQGILENSIKITNEPPTGMLANLHKALDNFSQEALERCVKEAEFKPIVFGLCYFHAVVTERRKFGAQGWNRQYPFNVGDLTICVDVLFNYLEVNPKIPWEDLRYLFGEIMYGGHITDDWDRRLCRSYLEEYMQPELIEGEHMLAPGFAAPPNLDYKGYHRYIDEELPPESPCLYGLHPNAEIEVLTSFSERIFRTVFEMQPRDTSAASGDGLSRDEILRNILDELVDRMPDGFNMAELQAKQQPEERTPYTVVVLQECHRMNTLIAEMRRSLKEFNLGLKGELTITQEMEALGNSLFLDQVPESWNRYAYPSLMPLGLWFADLLSRVKDLDAWTQDFSLPGAVWLGGLFNPQSFLTAVMQQTARKNEWPLDRMVINCDVTKKSREDMGMAPREGAYVHGLFMEGARWDMQANSILEARVKELAPMMPVIFLKAVPVDRQDLKGTYACPVYKTKHRGPTFVWTFNLKSKEKPGKWILGGVALLLQV